MCGRWGDDGGRDDAGRASAAAARMGAAAARFGGRPRRAGAGEDDRAITSTGSAAVTN